jgi:hypothetical protein
MKNGLFIIIKTIIMEVSGFKSHGPNHKKKKITSE